MIISAFEIMFFYIKKNTGFDKDKICASKVIDSAVSVQYIEKLLYV